MNHVVSTIRAIIIIHGDSAATRPRDYPPEETRDPGDSGPIEINASSEDVIIDRPDAAYTLSRGPRSRGRMEATERGFFASSDNLSGGVHDSTWAATPAS